MIRNFAVELDAVVALIAMLSGHFAAPYLVGFLAAMGFVVVYYH
jgi:hypothetical protein